MKTSASILFLLPLLFGSLTTSLVAQGKSDPNSWTHDLDTPRRPISDVGPATLEIRLPDDISSALGPPVKFAARSYSLRRVDGSGPTPFEARERYKRKDVLGSLINRSSTIIHGRGISRTERQIDETTSKIETTLAVVDMLKGPSADKELKVTWTDITATDARHPSVEKEHFTEDGIWFIIEAHEALLLGQRVEWMPNEMLESVSEIIKNTKP